MKNEKQTNMFTNNYDYSSLTSVETALVIGHIAIFTNKNLEFKYQMYSLTSYLQTLKNDHIKNINITKLTVLKHKC